MSRSDGPDVPQVPTTIGRPFANGNPGRPQGSKNRTTRLAAALPEGKCDKLVGKAFKIGEAGNVPMLKFLLAPFLPRERLIEIDLPPLECADDAVDALGHIMRAVSEGRITPTEGAALAALIDSQRRAIDTADLVKRMDSLEAKIAGGRAP